MSRFKPHNSNTRVSKGESAQTITNALKHEQLSKESGNKESANKEGRFTPAVFLKLYVRDQAGVNRPSLLALYQRSHLRPRVTFHRPVDD